MIGRARRFTLLASLTLLAGAPCLLSCAGEAPHDDVPAPAPTVSADAGTPGPWERTETREPCARFDPLRGTYFGDLHVHTRLSADAYIYGTRQGPDEAYAFARGEEIAVSDDDEAPTRRARIDRPLDFMAVTDHSEFYGEVNLCLDASSPVYDGELCDLLRRSDTPDDQGLVGVKWLYLAGVTDPPDGLPFCSDPGVDCKAAAVSVWKQIQASAEAAYDRTSACTLTTFVGYEHTASPGGKHLHRNVIFRNEHVLPHAVSQVDTGSDIPAGLWTALESGCLSAGTGCDALIIPHNSNLSGGEQWLDPVDATQAERRGRLEPLAEVHQNKGNSECRFDRVAGAGAGTTDELCAFEQLTRADEDPFNPPASIDSYPRRNLLRNTLKDGLLLEQKLGVNPFKLGLIGSTDTHDATPGNTDERGWVGASGNHDASDARKISASLRNNPGGLAVAWAEENSRDAIFSALRRRETYATSGTRPVVRFFAGGLDGVSCDRADFVERAYQTGTPMGGDVGARAGAESPRFALLAIKDAGTDAVLGADLERAQIVKGWVGADGLTHEKVFDVAGDADNGASVDEADCEPRGAGAAQLCTLWKDPEFDASERSFYYVRVLENPTCRWSTRVCKSAGVDPFAKDCAAQAAKADPRFADCCTAASSDPFYSPTVQERAWTSPIWYRPEAIAGVDGHVSFGPQGSDDVLGLDVRIGKLPPSLDWSTTPLTVRVSDDDDLFLCTLPDGAVQADATGRHFDVDASLTEACGLVSLSLDIDAGGEAHLSLETQPGDLVHAERSTHAVTVSLTAGLYEAAHTRFWQFHDGELVVTDGP